MLRDRYVTVVTEIDVIILTSSCYYENWPKIINTEQDFCKPQNSISS
jgi:hypothetical protein